jgi:hypothetical protein
LAPDVQPPAADDRKGQDLDDEEQGHFDDDVAKADHAARPLQLEKAEKVQHGFKVRKGCGKIGFSTDRLWNVGIIVRGTDLCTNIKC